MGNFGQHMEKDGRHRTTDGQTMGEFGKLWPMLGHDGQLGGNWLTSDER